MWGRVLEYGNHHGVKNAGCPKFIA
jgi:hypothetical protein